MSAAVLAEDDYKEPSGELPGFIEHIEYRSHPLDIAPEPEGGHRDHDMADGFLAELGPGESWVTLLLGCGGASTATSVSLALRLAAGLSPANRPCRVCYLAAKDPAEANRQAKTETSRYSWKNQAEIIRNLWIGDRPVPFDVSGRGWLGLKSHLAAIRPDVVFVDRLQSVAGHASLDSPMIARGVVRAARAAAPCHWVLMCSIEPGQKRHARGSTALHDCAGSVWQIARDRGEDHTRPGAVLRQIKPKAPPSGGERSVCFG